jgi:hypothetical protein
VTRAPNPQPQEWRCRCCKTLLGIADGDVIHIKYKQVGFAVRGEVKTRCRRCETPSEMRSTDLLRAGA